jgi:hypothetical protein
MNKANKLLPLLVAIASTIFGLFLGEWLQIITAPLFAQETRAILSGLIFVGLLATIAVVANLFFAQRAEEREQKWLEIEKRLGDPAEIEFEIVPQTGMFNKKLAELIRNVTTGDEILILATHNPPGNRDEYSPDYLQSLEEYARTLIEKAQQPGIIYRRIVCFREGPEQGKISAERVQGWFLKHAEEMMKLREVKPGKVTLKKSRPVLGPDLLLIKDKVGVISLDMYSPKTGKYHTGGMIIFHNPPNGDILQTLYELFMLADNESLPVEKVPEG